jgi:hypothetical protein
MPACDPNLPKQLGSSLQTFLRHAPSEHFKAILAEERLANGIDGPHDRPHIEIALELEQPRRQQIGTGRPERPEEILNQCHGDPFKNGRLAGHEGLGLFALDLSPRTEASVQPTHRDDPPERTAGHPRLRSPALHLGSCA